MSFDLKSFLVATLLCALVLASGSYAADDPEVTTPLGRIKGSLMSTRLNKTIYAFRGVRYGKSTEGDRRYKLAVPVDPWGGVEDASQEGPSCPLPAVPQLASEDCLRVNVYTTKLPNGSEKVNRPVIVFFHPGGFYGFSGQSYVFGPQYFLDQDIVLVTVNYRLTSFGFMATGDARAPGNLGLKDQVAALRWIRDNIASFGGNPNSVTITGYSAGSWSVILHMMSPMSAGLFHRVVAMSGSPVTPEPLPTEQKHLITKHASFVGCPTDNLDKSIECLRKTPHQKISDVQPQFLEWYTDPTLIWSPVVEPYIPGVERFLTAQPVDLIRQRRFQHVPLITGITKDEFLSLAITPYQQALKGNDSIFRNFTENWDHAAPISFQYERDTPHSKYVSQQLKKYYLRDQPITVKNARDFGHIYGDSIIGYPTELTANLMAEYNNAPTWNYHFVYQGRSSFVMLDGSKTWGVMHHDDLQYLYYMSFVFPYVQPNDPEAQIIERQTALYANFAKTGEPIPKNNRLFRGVTWDNMRPRERQYLEIGTEMKMKSRLNEDRYALWQRLFPLKPVRCS